MFAHFQQRLAQIVIVVMMHSLQNHAGCTNLHPLALCFFSIKKAVVSEEVQIDH